MGGGSRSKSGTMSVFKRRVASGDGDGENITMGQVNAITAKNEKAMQSIIESYRRSGNNTPLWLSTTPYYKKDSLLVINLRDENIPLAFSTEQPVASAAISSNFKKTEAEVRPFPKAAPLATSKDRHTSAQPGPSSSAAPKSFAVSGGEAASRLGLRIGAAADASPSMQKEMIEAKEAPKQPEMTIVPNVRNLGSAAGATTSWNSLGLDTILGGAAPVDPLTINSDPLWGADTSSNTTSDHELQTMLSVLKDLTPVTFEPASASPPKEKVPEFTAPVASTPVGPSTVPLPMQVSSVPPATVVAPMQSAPQYYYFMSPEGVPMMAPMPIQTGGAVPYMAYPPVHQHHQQQYVPQVAPPQTMHQTYITPQQMATQQHQYITMAAQLQQQQLAAQQQAALAALQLSKGPSPKPSPAPNTNTSKDGAFKAPNPNARPFQPHESRFNVEAVPFVPPSGR